MLLSRLLDQMLLDTEPIVIQRLLQVSLLLVAE